MVETNNRKVIDKDYLAKQFYIYNKEYIIPLDEKKQDNITSKSKHVILNENSELNINIVNQETAKNNDYLRLFSNEDGIMEWKTPKDEVDYSTDNEDDTLITAKALANFAGSETINTIGEITKGSWKVGKISITEDALNFDNINVKVDVDNKKLNIFADEDGWNIENEIDIKTQNIIAKKLTIGTTQITEDKIETKKLSFGKVDLSESENDLKFSKNDENSIVNFKEIPIFLNEIKTNQKNNKNYIIINENEYYVTTSTDCKKSKVRKIFENLNLLEEVQS